MGNISFIQFLAKKKRSFIQWNLIFIQWIFGYFLIFSQYLTWVQLEMCQGLKIGVGTSNQHTHTHTHKPHLPTYFVIYNHRTCETTSPSQLLILYTSNLKTPHYFILTLLSFLL